MADTSSTLTEALQYWAQHDGEKDAFVFYNKHGLHSRLSRELVFKAASRFAARLKRAGLQHGDIVANSITNSPERIISDFGILLAGCVTVNCQVIEKDGADLWYLADRTKCKAIVLAAANNNPAYLLLSDTLTSTSGSKLTSGSYDISLPKAPSVEKVIVANRKEPSSGTSRTINNKNDNPMLFSNFISNLIAENEGYVANVKPSDLAYIFLTSGSTGFGKLVPRWHGELMSIGYKIATEGLTILIDRPYGWIGGFALSYFINGTTFITQDWYDGEQARTPRELWTLFERAKISATTLHPAQVKEFIQEFKDDPPEFKLKYVFTGGQPVTKHCAGAIGLLAGGILPVYGSTEMMLVSGSPIHKPEELEDYIAGKIFPNCDVKIVDADGKELPPGTDGSIIIKSPYLFSGYYNLELSKPVFTADGYFISGDRGRVDKDGNLFCYGREGEVMNKGPIIIYLSWPEGILEHCPGVQEVVVVPLTGADWGGQELRMRHQKTWRGS